MRKLSRSIHIRNTTKIFASTVLGGDYAYISTRSVSLVPSDIRGGDKLCVFNNTYYPFILHKVQDGKHVVIGEACKYLALC